MLLRGIWVGDGAGTGWIVYPLLSNNVVHMGSVVWLIIFFLYLAGVSSLIRGIDFTTTIVNARPGGTPTKDILYLFGRLLLQLSY